MVSRTKRSGDCGHNLRTDRRTLLHGHQRAAPGNGFTGHILKNDGGKSLTKCGKKFFLWEASGRLYRTRQLGTCLVLRRRRSFCRLRNRRRTSTAKKPRPDAVLVKEKSGVPHHLLVRGRLDQSQAQQFPRKPMDQPYLSDWAQRLRSPVNGFSSRSIPQIKHSTPTPCERPGPSYDTWRPGTVLASSGVACEPTGPGAAGYRCAGFMATPLQWSERGAIANGAAGHRESAGDTPRGFSPLTSSS